MSLHCFVLAPSLGEHGERPLSFFFLPASHSPEARPSLSALVLRLAPLFSFLSFSYALYLFLSFLIATGVPEGLEEGAFAGPPVPLLPTPLIGGPQMPGSSLLGAAPVATPAMVTTGIGTLLAWANGDKGATPLCMFCTGASPLAHLSRALPSLQRSTPCWRSTTLIWLRSSRSWRQ